MVNLGDRVRDVVSGFEGVAVARYSYLQGCDRISVQPGVDKDGKMPETEAFDEPQLEIVKKGVVSQGNKDNGGPERYMPKRQLRDKK